MSAAELVLNHISHKPEFEQIRCDFTLCNVQNAENVQNGKENETKLLACTKCFSALYCCADHQKEDWKRHRLECIPLPQSMKMECKKREIIVRSIPSSSKSRGVFYRGSSPEEAGRNMLQCDDYIFESQPFQSKWNFAEANQEELYDQQSMKALAVVASQFFAKEYDLFEMKNWYPALIPRARQTTDFTANQKAILLQQVPPRFKLMINSWMECCQICFTFSILMRVSGPNNSDLSHFVFAPSTALLNHSCRPNCTLIMKPVITLDEDRKEELRQCVSSQTQIQPGDELTVSYAPQVAFWPFEQRYAYLLEKFHFVCACKICSVESERNFRDALLLKKKSHISTMAHSTEKEMETALEQIDSLQNMMPSSSSRDSLELQQQMEYDDLSARMGMKQVNMRAIKSSSEKEINEWILDTERFIERYKLGDTHWHAHNLRLWSARVQALFPHHKSQMEATLNARHAIEIIRRNIRVNAQLLMPCEYLKEQEFSLFEHMSKVCGKQIPDIYMELSEADGCFGYFKNTWFDISIDNIINRATTNNNNNNRSNNNSNNNNNGNRDKITTKGKLQQKLQKKKE
jgi:hypothetical protein